MKFTRRPDLAPQTRIDIVMLAWLHRGVLRQNDGNRKILSDIQDLSLSPAFDGKPPVGNAV